MTKLIESHLVNGKVRVVFKMAEGNVILDKTVDIDGIEVVANGKYHIVSTSIGKYRILPDEVDELMKLSVPVTYINR